MPHHRPLLLRAAATIGIVFASLLIGRAGAEPAGTTPRQAIFATREEAEAAAAEFHCRGAHRMGDQWMPCASHGEDGGRHGGGAAPTRSTTP